MIVAFPVSFLIAKLACSHWISPSVYSYDASAFIDGICATKSNSDTSDINGKMARYFII